MYTTPRPIKTYGRRLSMRDKSGSTSSANAHTSQNSDDEGPPRKRRTLLQSTEFGSGKRNEERIAPSPRSLERKATLPQYDSREITPPSRGTKNAASPKESPISKGKGKEAVRVVVDYAREPPASSSVPQSSLSTPKKNNGLKDLSDIFSAVSRSPSPSKAISKSLQRTSSLKPSGLAKRMLARSRTDSSIESSPKSQEDGVLRHHSFAEALVSDRSPRAGPSRIRDEHESQESSQSAMSDLTGSQTKEPKNVRRTYAGHSRSFLFEIPASSVMGEGRNGPKIEGIDEDNDALRDSYSELRKRWGVDNVEAESVDEGADNGGVGLYNPLFSITDLRSKGESRRFMDEIGYLFEGLIPTSALSVRRNSAFEIISKLCDQGFWRKTRAAGLIGDIWDRLRAADAGNGDKVLDSILCCFVLLATEDPRDLAPLEAKSDYTSTIVQILEAHRRKDLFSAARIHESSPRKSKGVNNGEAMMMKHLDDLMTKALNISREECTPSVRLLLSSAFSMSPQLAFPHMTTILDSCIGDLSTLTKRLTAYRSGLPLLSETSMDTLCLYHIHNCLSILDSFLLNGNHPDESQAYLSKAELMSSYPDLQGGLVAINVATDVLERSSDSDGLQAHASRTSDLAFRVLINLTNDDSEWVESVTADEYTLPTVLRLISSSFRTMFQMDEKKLLQDSAEDVYAHAMDRLCLSLALLTNLAQESKDLVDLLWTTKRSASCEGTRKCLGGCCCLDGSDAITILVNIYISLLKRDDDISAQVEADSTFLRGHLAVLLGLLILQEGPHSHSLIDELPGSSAKTRLKGLMNHITEFTALYRKVTCRHGGGEENDDESQHAQQASHALSNDSMNADVITNVVSSLAALLVELT